MRSRFDEQLALLNRELIEMGALCEEVIALASRALTENDKSLAARVAPLDSEIDRKERDIENLCLKLLLQQQPVARDLRQISAALKMITDMERIGDQAEDIAEISKSEPASAKAAEACVWVEIRVYAREAVLVIPGLFIGIGQNLIRLVDFLEFFLSGFITGILIGVVFHGQLAVGLFNLGVGRVFLNAQHLVIISFVLICHSFSPQIRWATADRGGRAAPIKLYSAN